MLKLRAVSEANMPIVNTSYEALHPIQRYIYIYGTVVIMASMWYLLGFEHAHDFITEGSPVVRRSLVSEVPLMDPFTLFNSYNIYCRFHENDCCIKITNRVYQRSFHSGLTL